MSVVLEVGWYGSVWHTGTLACVKPFRHFLQMTAIPVCHNGSFVAIFWAQNITQMRLRSGLHAGHLGELTVLLHTS